MTQMSQIALARDGLDPGGGGPPYNFFILMRP